VNTDKIITASLVLYHNSEFDILKVVNSIINSKIYIKLYVVDNSNDESIKELLVDFDIYYIKNNKNLGFGKAHNIAIKIAVESNSDYHIIINPDISFDSNVVGELINRAEKEKEVGLIMPKINYPNGTVQFLCKLLPNPIVLIFRRFIPFKAISNWINLKYELRSMDFSKESEVPSLSGCFMFVRTTFLYKVGGFDERYFMYLEDIDLCRKLGEISKLIYFPEVTVIHNHEKGSYKSKKLLLLHIKSSIKYFNKWGWFIDRKRYEINKNAKKKLLIKNLVKLIT
jgi:GT2 family glycosyltransferase